MASSLDRSQTNNVPELLVLCVSQPGGAQGSCSSGGQGGRPGVEPTEVPQGPQCVTGQDAVAACLSCGARLPCLHYAVAANEREI
jgi:hypothetical protein